MVSQLENRDLEKERERESLDWNVYSVSNLCWWYDLRRMRRMVTRKTLKELLFSGKLSFQPKRKTMIYWKVENVRKKKKEKDKVRKQRFSGRFLPLFLCSVASSWSELDFLLSDIHIKPEWFKQSLDCFKSTRVQRPELFRKAWMWFKWERS